MKTVICFIVILCACFGNRSFAGEQSQNIRVDIGEVISRFAESSNRKVVVDPRVKGKIDLKGQLSEKLTYGDLLTLLAVHSMTAFEVNEYIIVIPINLAKQMPVPNVKEGETYSPDEYVLDIIYFEKVCPTELIITLRPLLPPTSHLSILQDPKAIVVTGSYRKIELMREVIQNLESHMVKPADCGGMIKEKLTSLRNRTTYSSLRSS